MAETVVVDQDECLGCEACVEICSSVFEMNDDGKAEAIEGADASLDCVEEAVGSCPAGCIDVE